MWKEGARSHLWATWITPAALTFWGHPGLGQCLAKVKATKAVRVWLGWGPGALASLWDGPVGHLENGPGWVLLVFKQTHFSKQHVVVFQMYQGA